eukprot:ANDGO_07926.mRNA.1 hypothetical protein
MLPFLRLRRPSFCFVAASILLILIFSLVFKKRKRKKNQLLASMVGAALRRPRMCDVKLLLVCFFVLAAGMLSSCDPSVLLYHASSSGVISFTSSGLAQKVVVPPYQSSLYTFSSDLRIDSVNGRLWWLRTEFPFGIMGSTLDGKPLKDNSTSFVFLERPARDLALAFDSSSLSLYLQDSDFVLHKIDVQKGELQRVTKMEHQLYRGTFYADSYMYFGSVDGCIYRFMPWYDWIESAYLCAPQIPLPQVSIPIALSPLRLYVADMETSRVVAVDMITHEVAHIFALDGPSLTVEYLSFDGNLQRLYFAGAQQLTPQKYTLGFIDLVSGKQTLLRNGVNEILFGLDVLDPPS